MFSNIGEISSAEFHVDSKSGALYVEYAHEAGGRTYITKVYLVCVPDSSEDILQIGKMNATNIVSNPSSSLLANLR